MLQNNEYHIPVLSNIAVDYLINPEIENQLIVDATLGGGGYTEIICEKLPPDGYVIAMDKDLNAIEYSTKRLEKFKNKINFVNGNFGELKKIIEEITTGGITGIALDLGLSSYQLENEDGFSFMKDTPLDMRAYQKDIYNASDILNNYEKNELIRIFSEYGEIGNEERLANAVIGYRKNTRIQKTSDILELVNNEYSIRENDLNKFLAKIFQALRIEVNNEIGNLKKVLDESVDLLRTGGRIVVVSYHSLEDRIVKNFFKEKSFVPSVSKYGTDYNKTKKILKVLTKKCVLPGRNEIRNNPRSRSAKLRAAEKL